MQYRLDRVPKERRRQRDSSLRAIGLSYERHVGSASFRMTGGTRCGVPRRVSGFRNHPGRDGWGWYKSTSKAIFPQAL